MRHLVTGGAGFLGSHLIDNLMQKGDYVICLDNLSTGDKNNIKKWIGNNSFKFYLNNSLNIFFIFKFSEVLKYTKYS